MPSADEDAGLGSWEGYEQGHAPAGSGTETSVPAEYNTAPDAAEYNTEPDAAESNTEPDAAEYNTEPDAAEYNTEPDAAEYNTEPDAAEYNTAPDAASATTPDNVQPADARVAEIKAMKKKDLDAELKKQGLETAGEGGPHTPHRVNTMMKLFH
jgi:hypothetical protein